MSGPLAGAPGAADRSATERLRQALRPDRLARSGIRGPLGALLTGPWVDRPTLWGIAEVWLPLSRLWAAAVAAKGDADAFLAGVPLEVDPGPVTSAHISRVLRGVERARRRAEEADAAWQSAFFGRARLSGDRLAELESRRIRAAQALLMQRLRLVWLYLRQPVPAVRFDVTSPEETERVYGGALDRPWALYAPPETMPGVTESRRMPTETGVDYWVRFASPAARMGDTAWARVHEPADAGPVTPTFLFANGIGVEFDQIDYSLDDMVALCRSGIRVIEVEAPWHGRRRPQGRFSGEPFLARAPVGAIDLLSAQAQELAVLIDWARTKGSPRVGIGGASLGALSSLMVASHGGHWPDRLRPDMAALITFTHRLSRLPFDSALARCTGLTDALAAAGWTPERLARFAPLTDPRDRLALDGHRLVAVLGEEDQVTPFEGVRDQVKRWGVPGDNVFIGKGGHFSTPMGLIRDRGPLDRVEALLRGGD